VAPKVSKPPATAQTQKSKASPSKPSPLGSSPPTNASDIESEDRNDSSSSSTPLISQIRRSQQTGANNSYSASRKSESAPKANGVKRKADNAYNDSNKRRQPAAGGSISSPPPSSSSSSVAGIPATSRNSYNSASSASPPASHHVLQLANNFKELYAKYERLYSELVTMVHPPEEKVKRVKEMHRRLEGMKMEIGRSAHS
jgi:RNA polymerase II elongation factor ELL